MKYLLLYMIISKKSSHNLLGALVSSLSRVKNDNIETEKDINSRNGYYIRNRPLLTPSTLSSSITNSNLQSLGTLNGLSVSGSMTSDSITGSSAMTLNDKLTVSNALRSSSTISATLEVKASSKIQIGLMKEGVIDTERANYPCEIYVNRITLNLPPLNSGPQLIQFPDDTTYRFGAFTLQIISTASDSQYYYVQGTKCNSYIGTIGAINTFTNLNIQIITSNGKTYFSVSNSASGFPNITAIAILIVYTNIPLPTTVSFPI